MARLTKEEKRVFDPSLLIQNQKWKSDTIKELMISEGKGGSPGTPTPGWDKGWPDKGTKPRPEDRPNIPTKLASLQDGKPDSSIMTHVTEKGFFLDGQGKSYMQNGGNFYDAGDYDLNIHGLPVPLAEYQARKGLKIAHGSHKPSTVIDGVPRFLDSGSHNPKDHEAPVDPSGNPIEQLRPKDEDILLSSLKINPADIPLGDGMIYEAKTKMQQNLKQKYDMMLENGMMSEQEYHKQMKRLMGTKK